MVRVLSCFGSGQLGALLLQSWIQSWSSWMREVMLLVWGCDTASVKQIVISDAKSLVPNGSGFAVETVSVCSGD